MRTHLDDPTAAGAARVAGLGYVAPFALGIFANLFVRDGLVDTDDAAATFANLAEHETLVRLAIVAFMAVFLIDVVVAWALHHVLRPGGAAISALAAGFRVVYAGLLGVAAVFLFTALELTGDDTHVAGLELSQREAHAMLALGAFDAAWLIGLAAFGIHLIVVGAIVIRTRLAPRAIGASLVVAGGAYVADTLAFSLLADYADREAAFTTIVAVPSIVAELAFTVWLLTSGRRRRPTGDGVAPLAGSPA